MDHKVVHFEIPADDVEALAVFYRDLLGWTIEAAPEFPDCCSVSPSTDEGALMGSMVKRWMPQQMPVNYVRVESVADYVAKARTLGATVVMDKTDIADTGWCAVLVDPQGNPLGLFEMMQKQQSGRGHDARNSSNRTAVRRIQPPPRCFFVPQPGVRRQETCLRTAKGG